MTDRPNKIVDGVVMPFSDDDMAQLAADKAAAANVAPATTPPLDFLAFLALFTPAEETAIFTARRTDVSVDKFLTMATGANRIDLGDARVQQGIGYLVSAELLTSDRASAVLSGTNP